ncbi:hypothetical protein L1887_06214 [Cichorium endivia]|nr:hypothetical protein L1887_06214 [Cichorium endivia]
MTSHLLSMVCKFQGKVEEITNSTTPHPHTNIQHTENFQVPREVTETTTFSHSHRHRTTFSPMLTKFCNFLELMPERTWKSARTTIGRLKIFSVPVWPWLRNLRYPEDLALNIFLYFLIPNFSEIVMESRLIDEPNHHLHLKGDTISYIPFFLPL